MDVHSLQKVSVHAMIDSFELIREHCYVSEMLVLMYASCHFSMLPYGRYLLLGHADLGLLLCSDIMNSCSSPFLIFNVTWLKIYNEKYAPIRFEASVQSIT